MGGRAPGAEPPAVETAVDEEEDSPDGVSKAGTYQVIVKVSARRAAGAGPRCAPASATRRRASVSCLRREPSSSVFHCRAAAAPRPAAPCLRPACATLVGRVGKARARRFPAARHPNLPRPNRLRSGHARCRATARLAARPARASTVVVRASPGRSPSSLLHYLHRCCPQSRQRRALTAAMRAAGHRGEEPVRNPALQHHAVAHERNLEGPRAVRVRAPQGAPRLSPRVTRHRARPPSALVARSALSAPAPPARACAAHTRRRQPERVPAHARAPQHVHAALRVALLL